MIHSVKVLGSSPPMVSIFNFLYLLVLPNRRFARLLVGMFVSVRPSVSDKPYFLSKYYPIFF